MESGGSGHRLRSQRDMGLNSSLLLTSCVSVGSYLTSLNPFPHRDVMRRKRANPDAVLRNSAWQTTGAG